MTSLTSGVSILLDANGFLRSFYHPQGRVSPVNALLTMKKAGQSVKTVKMEIRIIFSFQRRQNVFDCFVDESSS